MIDPHPTYTAISFAPVQGFIEKSRKLRDLFGASQILSYLSQQLIKDLEKLDLQVISPACVKVQKGMPNRILVKGDFIKRDRVKNILLKHWQALLKNCREWIEENLDLPPNAYFWSQPNPGDRRGAGEWERWGLYAWEIFWGYGDTPQAAMDDLETRKLKRDWIGVNWIGESSSITGTDAIAWPGLGKPEKNPGRSLTASEQQQLQQFYLRLAWRLDHFNEAKGNFPSDQALAEHFETSDGGKFISPRERLSIPELTKRLVTLPTLAKSMEIERLEQSFRDIYRESGYWTGWFMGDGDKVGDKLKELAERNADNPEQRDEDLKQFTTLLRQWGISFKDKKDLFPEGKGRVVYAGGDDFLGVLYSEELSNKTTQPEKIHPLEAWNWLQNLPREWQKLQHDIKESLDLNFTYSVGFVWAGHQVPQRDLLQHCREAEKRSKALGRDRLTIRVVFNSGQYIQWTCPWDQLGILDLYRDRNGKTGSQANWNHIYTDWATLKGRHAIQLDGHGKGSIQIDVAYSLFDFYFQGKATEINKKYRHNEPEDWTYFLGELEDSDLNFKIVNWMDNLIQVGWQLCRNSNP